ncbi:Exocyst complex subunit [Handroanthus impetiginosus]|uniref:Exocyst complex subunit n=1 Tax=Handroanthus impetiginosus TaxID=429701 RepID=A0A2G9GPZ0_9LAMI|nr:Exocyst complex subunit [Handroanthus impetiginosus]
MDSTSTSTSRFRFREHNQEMADGDSSEGHTSIDSSSFSSNEEEEPEVESMTAKGVQHLCSELLELKQESDEDFQKNIFSNYSAFLAILKEIEGLQNEILRLKNQASSQKKLVNDFSDGISFEVLFEETVEFILGETIHGQLSSRSILETHTENVSEILDTLISEHRLDVALAVLEKEGEFIQTLRSDENFSSDQLMSYNSTISEKMAMLADQFTLVAKHPRVSAPDLQKALLGLCQLGKNHLATELMLQYYHSRIASGMYVTQSTQEFPDVLYIKKVAKFVCSMISQALRSFVALNGGTYPYGSVLTQWASEEIEILAVCLNKYIKSLSEISGRLSAAVDAMQIAMSHCSLLETQRIFLQPSLLEHIRPCIDDVLQHHIDHLSKVISIFTSTDTWVLGRYYVSGILTGRSYAILDQQPEYFFLTNSGRKFVTLFQSVADEILPLIVLQMESSVLKGLMDLFTAYIVILECALTGDSNVLEKDGFRVNLPESTTQGVFILANLSTLMQFSFSIVRNIFDGIHQLEFEIDRYLMFIQDIYTRLKACFLDQFISNIFSPNVDHESAPEICTGWQGHSRNLDLIPSVPYLELYLELKKLQKLEEDDCIDMSWLVNLLQEAMDATFEWISSKSEIWTLTKENLEDHRTKFMQFTLDVEFLVEIARYGGYLSDNITNMLTDIRSRLEASFISHGLNPLRDMNDYDWPANAAIQALQKLEELNAKESLENENATVTREELQHHEPQVGSETRFEDSRIEPEAVNVPGLVAHTDTGMSRTEDPPIDEGDSEIQIPFYNRGTHEEVESDKNMFKTQEEKSPKISTSTNDLQTKDELSA